MQMSAHGRTPISKPKLQDAGLIAPFWRRVMNEWLEPQVSEDTLEKAVEVSSRGQFLISNEVIQRVGPVPDFKSTE